MTQEIKRITENGNRYYISPTTGNKLPSVTQILSKFEDQRGLYEWMKNNPEHAYVSHRASSLGTRVHTCNEELLTKGTVNFSKYEENPKVSEEQLIEIKARHNSYLPFLAYVNPISIEEKLIWERFNGVTWSGFAGTTDLIGQIQDPSFLKAVRKEQGAKVYTDVFKKDEPIIFVGDYKNHRSAKSPDRCIKAFCQLSAYAAAKNETLAPENKVKHGILLCTTCSEKTKKSNLYIYYLNLEELNFYFSWFHMFVQVYYGVTPVPENFTFKDYAKKLWGDFKSLAVGYYKAGEDPETGKAIWGKRDKNYLGKKLEIVL